jgi:RNA polymerase sigma-70 factor (ECF subfamily)
MSGPGTSGAGDPSLRWVKTRRDDDEILLRELRGADGEAAARALYRSYGGDLYGFAFNRVRDRGLAEEVVQEVFTRAWRKAGEFDAEKGGLRAWLYSIARNAVIDVQRQRARRPQLARYDTAPDDQPAHEPIDDAVVCWEARKALDGLTPAHREVLLLGELGLSVKEMATVTGLAEGTVRSRTHYALRHVRRRLEEMGMRP